MQLALIDLPTEAAWVRPLRPPADVSTALQTADRVATILAYENVGSDNSIAMGLAGAVAATNASS
jgi:hypothetical protein